METMLAAVKVGARKVDIQEIPVPEISEDSALMKIEAAGMCGAYATFTGKTTNKRSSVPGMNGHENAGVIVKAGKIFKSLHNVEEGELVALEEYIPCLHCEWCRQGEYRHCWMTDTHNNPNHTRLTGGFSQYLRLPLNSVLHKLPQHVSPDEAALALPIGNGVQWACVEGEAGPGKTIVVQGPGSKGLGCVLASRMYGADTVIVTGLSKDQRRFEAAKALGADHTVDVQTNDFTKTIMDITNGRGADAVIDCTTGGSSVVFTQASSVLVRRGGIIVTQRYKVNEFDLEDITGKYAQLRACRGHSYRSVETGLSWIASGRHPLKDMITHHYPVSRAADAFLASGGEGDDGANAVWVMMNPWMQN
ncbi:MAG: zinc-binding dehydrogenase [Dehalococcoidia bacterium]